MKPPPPPKLPNPSLPSDKPPPPNDDADDAAWADGPGLVRPPRAKPKRERERADGAGRPPPVAKDPSDGGGSGGSDEANALGAGGGAYARPVSEDPNTDGGLAAPLLIPGGGPAFGWSRGERPCPLRGSPYDCGGDGRGGSIPLPNALGKAAENPAGVGPDVPDGPTPDPVPRAPLGPPPSCASSAARSGLEAYGGPDVDASAKRTPPSGGDEAGSDRGSALALGSEASANCTGAGVNDGLLPVLAEAAMFVAEPVRAKPSAT